MDLIFFGFHFYDCLFCLKLIHLFSLHLRQIPPRSLEKDQSNVKCKLLHWEGTNLVVAEGQIASRDLKSKVHCVNLGLMCWNIWVNHVIVNVPLFRSTHEVHNLQDVIGSTIAWISQFILSN
ncbi:hypothetical protein ACSBR1_004719 [Camellia fascicularis]